MRWTNMSWIVLQHVVYVDTLGGGLTLTANLLTKMEHDQTSEGLRLAHAGSYWFRWLPIGEDLRGDGEVAESWVKWMMQM